MILYFLILSLGILTIYVSCVYFVAIKINNFSIIDIAWSAGFTIIVLMLKFISTGNEIRNNLLVLIVSCWSLRLAYHLFVRIKRDHPIEEGRYLELRAKWQPHLKRNFYIFFVFQGISITFLSLPFVLISLNHTPKINLFEYIGILIWLIAILGEGISDFQLSKFKMNPQNRGKVCEIGFWNYSRHPNYFFEWMIWIGYFIFAFSAPYGYWACISPLVILFLLLKVTGIPTVEAQSLRSKGHAYILYQKTTSKFIPWFKKKV